MKIAFHLFLFTLSWGHAYSQDQLEKIELRYPNGSLMVEGTSLNGQKHGISKTYYSNGVLKTRNNWKNDVQIGETTHWYPNGGLSYTGFLSNGLESGAWRYYDQLDGDSVYTVYYKYGKIDSVTYDGDKYRWRTINLPLVDFTFQFPSYLVDSAYTPGVFIGYWTMFPYENKKDVEFYSVMRFDKKMELTNFFNRKEGELTSEEWMTLTRLFGSGLYDPSVPSLDFDRYKVLKSKLVPFNGKKNFELIILYTDLEVEFKAVIIPFSDGYQVISGFFNKHVPQEQRDRYFNSIQLK